MNRMERHRLRLMWEFEEVCEREKKRKVTTVSRQLCWSHSALDNVIRSPMSSIRFKIIQFYCIIWPASSATNSTST